MSNSDDPDWSNLDNPIDSEWGDPNLETSEGGWYTETEDEIQINDKYIILLKSREKPYLFTVTMINSEDNIVELSDKKTQFD